MLSISVLKNSNCAGTERSRAVLINPIVLFSLSSEVKSSVEEYAYGKTGPAGISTSDFELTVTPKTLDSNVAALYT